MEDQSLSEILVCKEGQSPQQCLEAFANACQPGKVATLQFKIGDVSSSVRCFAGDLRKIEMKLGLHAPDDETEYRNHDVLSKDVRRVGRAIVSALQKKGYHFETKYRWADPAQILASGECVVTAPEGITPEKLAADFAEAHITGNRFMGLLLRKVPGVEQESAAAVGIRF